MGKRALFRNTIGTYYENSQFWVKNWYLHSKCHVRIEVNTDNACKSRWHFGRSTGLANCAKKSMHASVDLVQPNGHIVQHFWCCNLSKCCRFVHFFQWNESEHVVLPIVIICHSVRWISGAPNEHSMIWTKKPKFLNGRKVHSSKSPFPSKTQIRQIARTSH